MALNPEKSLWGAAQGARRKGRDTRLDVTMEVRKYSHSSQNGLEWGATGQQILSFQRTRQPSELTV